MALFLLLLVGLGPRVGRAGKWPTHEGGTLSQSTPHDSLFKQVFGRTAVAREHIRSLLPPALARQIDWRTMARFPGTTIDERFKSLHSDLVFRASTRGGEPLLMFLLFEHQSSPHPVMPLRMLGYMVRLWQNWLKRPDSKGRALPRIFPLVLYNGIEEWTAPTTMRELYPEDGLDEVFGEHQPRLRFVLQDLSQIQDEEITGQSLRVLALLVLKHAKAPDFWERFALWHSLMAKVAQSDGLTAVEAVFRYGWLVAGEPAPEVEGGVWAALPSGVEELAVTWAERTRAEGREEGLASIRKVLTLHLERLGELTDEMRNRIEDADAEQLEAWMLHVVSTATGTVTHIVNDSDSGSTSDL